MKSHRTMGTESLLPILLRFSWISMEIPLWSLWVDLFSPSHRRRGCEQLFKVSIELHEEKAVTFPTDTKLHIKIISKCKMIARKESITLRRSFVHELPELLRIVRFCNGKKTAHKQRSAKKTPQNHRWYTCSRIAPQTHGDIYLQLLWIVITF